MNNPYAISQAVARRLLLRNEPEEVAFTNSKGEHFDEDGERIEKRRTVEWTWSLGPFGSWPSTVEDALADIERHDTWTIGESIRCGMVMTYKPGWGYAIAEPKAPELDLKAMSRTELLAMADEAIPAMHGATASVDNLLRRELRRPLQAWGKRLALLEHVEAVRREVEGA